MVSEPSDGPYYDPSGAEEDEEEEVILFGPGKPSIQVPVATPDVPSPAQESASNKAVPPFEDTTPPAVDPSTTVDMPVTHTFMDFLFPE